MGYYHDRRQRPGSIFELLDDRHFSDAHRTDGRPGWMEKVSDEIPVKELNRGVRKFSKSNKDENVI